MDSEKVEKTKKEIIVQRTIALILLVLITGFPYLYNDLTVKASGEDWLPTFLYRKSHVVPIISGAGYNSSLKVIVYRTTGTDTGKSVYVGTKCQVDYDDIRFTTSDGITQLPYWREYYNITCATFWVRFPSGLNVSETLFYIYYSNPLVSTTSQSFIESGCVLWYIFDEGKGTNVFDHSLNGNNGTIVGSTYTWLSDSLNLSGSTNNYINVGNPVSLQITGNITVIERIKRYANSLYGGVGRWSAANPFNNSYQLGTYAARTFEFIVRQNSSAYGNSGVSSAISAGTWYTITGAYNQSSRRVYLYINKSPISALTSITSIQIGLSAFYIGRYGSDVDKSIYSWIAVYNKFLSATEIKAQYEGKNRFIFDNSLNGAWGTEENSAYNMMMTNFQTNKTILPNLYFTYNVSVSSFVSKNCIKNVTLYLSQGHLELQWINSTDTFLISYDAYHVATLGACYSEIVNDTTVKLTWLVKLDYGYPTGYTDVTDDYTRAWDNLGNSVTGSQYHFFSFYTTDQNLPSGGTIDTLLFIVLFSIPIVLIVLGIKVPLLCFFAIFEGFIFNVWLIANDIALLYNSAWNSTTNLWETHVVPIPAQPYLSLLAMMIYIMGSIIVFISKEHD